ncbi:2-keto-3-deoxy-6-phosphogluconate aldolase [Caldicoprobacter guelmensis]|uniref:hydrolase n=1 Tax=Caldicoprobacter guelmensis TaxID=1170224 RepID=UPI001956DBAE|nr:hydrolase [Caldicoprobacter guelmensis]MBM7581694.1 2-keto-3-deoxy-6-phosphogluconate aldolase [Caldicoprobacter guelmensis]
MTKYIPEIKGTLRKHLIEVPACIQQASGIRIFGKVIRSLAFTTDVAVIKNINADAIMAVYPFTPQPAITQAIMMAADVPVFCGVGGGITTGKRVVNLALDAEFKGAIGVVVNAPTPNEVISMMRETIDIPIVVTVVSENTDFKARVEAGATILNVSGARKTVDIIKKIRDQLPTVPIIATGGPSEETIMATIEAGANAITYTPPTPAELFKAIMDKYREELS